MCMLDCAAALHWQDTKLANNWQTILTNSVQLTAESVSVAAAARRPGCIQQPSRLSVSTVIPRFKSTRSELRKNQVEKVGGNARIWLGGVPLVPSHPCYGSDHSPCSLLTSQFFERGYKQTEAMLLQAGVEAGIWWHRIMIIFIDHA